MGTRQTRLAAMAMVVVALAPMVSACTTGSPDREALERLASLGSRWLASPTSATYRTLERDAGEATSIHQCLRQYADWASRMDRQTAIAICSGEGTVTFIRDPPSRWRMDVVTGPSGFGLQAGAFALISMPAGTYRCLLDEGVASDCAPATRRDRTAPFPALLRPPGEMLDALMADGAEVTRSDGRTIAGVQAECFSAAGTSPDDPSQAEWCYSGTGVLLWFSATTPSGSTRLEASDVSMNVPPTAFALAVPADTTDLAPS